MASNLDWLRKIYPETIINDNNIDPKYNYPEPRTLSDVKNTITPNTSKNYQTKEDELKSISQPLVDTKYSNVYVDADMRKLSSILNGGNNNIDQAISVAASQKIPITKNISADIYGKHGLGSSAEYNYGGSVNLSPADNTSLFLNKDVSGNNSGDLYNKTRLGAKYSNDIVNAEIARSIINERGNQSYNEDSMSGSVKIPDTPFNLRGSAYSSDAQYGSGHGNSVNAEYINDGLAIGLGSSKDSRRNNGNREYSINFNKRF